MKWLVLALLLSNLVFFGFHQYFKDATHAHSSDSAPQDDGSIKLVSEVPQISEPKEEVIAPPVIVNDVIDISPDVDVTAEAKIIETCFSLRGFDSDAEAQQELDRLLARGFVGGLVATESKELSSYWVVSKQFATQEEAVKLLRQMRNASIDSYVIESGDSINSVSVGLFKSERHAAARQRAVAKKGFDVSVKENYKTVIHHELALTYRGLETESLVADYAQGLAEKLTLEEKNCKEK